MKLRCRLFGHKWDWQGNKTKTHFVSCETCGKELNTKEDDPFPVRELLPI